MPAGSLDQRVRLTAFDWLESQCTIHGEVLPWALLLRGFDLDGERVPLVSQQGIFKPRLCDLPLTLRTSPDGPYRDAFGPDGLLRYAYRGTNTLHRENVGLHRAMQSQAPLAYLHGLLPGKYLAIWPVYVVGDDPGTLFFSVAVDDPRHATQRLSEALDGHTLADPASDTARRAYITTTVRRRVHQQAFRERVLQAYREQCALCRLRHPELLDAAHIIADREEGGDPAVQNGLALCKLHHAAFDSYFLTVRPDYRIIVRRDVLEEEDGPMLRHGLQGLHDRAIEKPRSKKEWPDPERLKARWQRFQDEGRRV